MYKKLLSTALILILTLSLFSSCKGTVKGEDATIKSDIEAETVVEQHSFAQEEISNASEAKTVGTASSFNSLLTNPDVNVASYKGSEDISIINEEYIDKTVAIDTIGSVSIDCPVKSVVLFGAAGGVTLNEKTDSIIIKGEDVTLDVMCETGSIYIEGKNAVVNVKNADVGTITARNVTSVIKNHTDSDITVTLTNGAKVTVGAKLTYVTKDNFLQENALD